MDLGIKESNGELAISHQAPSSTKPKEVIRYPSFTIEKSIGKEYGDEFDAKVRVRIKNVEHGDGYDPGKERHRTEIQVMSLEPIKADKKKAAGRGLPS